MPPIAKCAICQKSVPDNTRERVKVCIECTNELLFLKTIGEYVYEHFLVSGWDYEFNLENLHEYVKKNWEFEQMIKRSVICNRCQKLNALHTCNDIRVKNLKEK